MNFLDFSKEERELLESNGFEITEEYHAYSDAFDMDIYHHRNGKYYVAVYEAEYSELEYNGNLYELTDVWYMPFDLNRFISDINDIDPDEFFVEDYRLEEED